jgi:hypothetical protein
VTTPGTTENPTTEVAASAAGAALAEGLEAVARLHDEAMDRIAQLAEDGAVPEDAPEDEVRVLRLLERPDVLQRAEPAAA